MVPDTESELASDTTSESSEDTKPADEESESETVDTEDGQDEIDVEKETFTGRLFDTQEEFDEALRLQGNGRPVRSRKAAVRYKPDDFKAKLAAGLNQDEVKNMTFKEAVGGPYGTEWIKSIKSEYESLLKNETWEETTLPRGRKPIRTKWVFKIKENPDGSTARYKSRLVAKGMTQKQGIDYQETFAPVIRTETLRLILAIACVTGSEIIQMDVRTAYLNAELDEEIYTEIPEGYDRFVKPNSVAGHNKGNGGLRALRLKKSLYGLKQAARMWNKRFMRAMKTYGLEQSKVDPCMFYTASSEKLIIVSIYVDDVIIVARDGNDARRVRDMLLKEFECDVISEGPEFWVLGCEIIRNRKEKTLTITQRKYISDKLEQFNMKHCNGLSVPMEPTKEYSKLMCPISDEEN